MSPQFLEFRPLDIDTINRYKQGEGARIFYIKDSKDQIFVVDKPLRPSDGGVLIVQAHGDVTGDVRITEFGLVESDESKNLKFKTQMKFDSETPSDVVEATEKNALTKTQYLDCLSLLQKQTKTGTIVWDHIKANTGVQIGVELLFNPLSTPEDKKRMATDVIGGIAMGSLKTWSGTKIVQGGNDFISYSAVTLPLGLSTTVMQNGLNKVAGATKANQGDDLSFYNYTFLVAMWGPNYMLTKWFSNGLPGRLYERCRKGEPLKIWMRPDMLRWVERVGQTTLYFAPRELFLKTNDKTEPSQTKPK